MIPEGGGAAEIGRRGMIAMRISLRLRIAPIGVNSQANASIESVRIVARALIDDRIDANPCFRAA